MAPSQPISTIRRRYPRQWLMIRVTKMDDATTTPLAGTLLAHSRDRDEIFVKSIGQKGLIYVDHPEAGKTPKGFAFAF